MKKAFYFKCLLLCLSLFFAIPSNCFAETNVTKINSLLQEFYSEMPEEKNNEDFFKTIMYDRLRIAREVNFSSKRLRNCILPEKTVEKSAVFSKIYDQNYWNGPKSRSGPGSKLISTQSIRENLPKLWEKYNIKSVLDAPCGDYNWMKTVDKKDINYIGADIVPQIIKENNKKYKSDSVSFEVIDITSDKIPQVDMIICRDCLQNLSYKNVLKALKNFKDSGSTYLLVTSYPWTLENWDIYDGDYRPLNLLQKPFNLKKNYLEKIRETTCSENEKDKYMYLYKLKDINLDNIKLNKKLEPYIPIAMALDDNYLYPTIVSITSIMENSNHKTMHDFYIMHPGNFSATSKAKLKTLEKKYDNCNINLIDMQDRYKNAYDMGHITTPAYYRLSLSKLLPELDKIIWLDGDTLVFSDLSDMFSIDMDGYYYKGALDFPYTQDFIKNFGIYNDHYICSGVMLVNLKELRRDNMVKKFDEFIKNNNEKLIQHDQTVINFACNNKNGILPAKFGIFNQPNSFFEIHCNVLNTLKAPDKYNLSEIFDANEKPAVLHFTHKPWIYPDTASRAEIWWQYAQKTGFIKEIQEKYFIPNGTYEIVSELDHNKTLDIADGSREQKAKLQLYDKNGSAAQKFKVVYDKDGYFTIQAECSGKMLDVPNGNIDSGTELWQYENNNTDAQKWYIIPNLTGDFWYGGVYHDGPYRIVSKLNGLCMDVKYANTSNETPIQCCANNGSKAQKFKFIADVPDGIYQIVSELDHNKALDIVGASREQGAKLQLWGKNDTTAQKFKIAHDKDGYFTIQAVCSGKMLDVPCGNIASGTELWQYGNNGTDAQKWRFISYDDGTYSIISKCNGMAIDIRNGNVANGTPIQCFNKNDTQAQKFRFIKP